MEKFIKLVNLIVFLFILQGVHAQVKRDISTQSEKNQIINFSVKNVNDLVPLNENADPISIAKMAKNPDSLNVIKTARKDVAFLSKASLFGRGYTKNGHTNAANYIKKRFGEIGLEKVPGTENYFQYFDINVNIFNSISLTIDKKKLSEGKDYIVRAYSQSYEANSEKVVTISSFSELSKKNMKGKTVFIPKELEENGKKINELEILKTAIQNEIPAVIFTKKKLTALMSQQSYPITVIDILENEKVKKISEISAKIDIKTQKVTTQNVCAFLPVEGADSTIIIIAHYDHLGTMGKAIFYGGNDNASGTALLLSLANFAKIKSNQLKTNILFIAMSAEEVGLMGAKYYVEHPLIPLEKTKSVLNFDLVGYGEKGLMFVGAKDFTNLRDDIFRINEKYKLFEKINQRPNAPNSDHFPFTEKNIPAIFAYTEGGNPYYHDVFDKGNTLSYAKFYNLYRLIGLYLTNQN